MSEPSSKAPSRSPPSRWLTRLTILLILLVTLALCGIVYRRVVGDGRLEEVVAELDRTDPGWRWEDLHRQRAQVPDQENSALRVLAVHAKIPAGSSVDLSALPPEQRIGTELLKQLRDVVVKARPALDEALPIAEMPRGRFLVEADIEAWVASNMEHGPAARNVVTILLLKAALDAEDARPDEAMRATRAAINAGRCFGDEPTMIAHLVRIACVNTSLSSLERVVAQSEPAADDLLVTQKLLEHELTEPMFFWAARGERAYLYAFFSLLNNPELLRRLAPAGKEPGWFDDLKATLRTGEVRSGQAKLLEHSTEAIRASQLPMHQRRRAVQDLDRKIEVAPASNLLFMSSAPAYGKLANAFDRNHAQLGCAAVALAAERFRIRHGRWPETLGELVPDFIAKLPEDPFDGALRMTKLPDGLMIYSVGYDGIDDGGSVIRNAALMTSGGPVQGLDVGFRLWDPAKRRQPAPVTEEKP